MFAPLWENRILGHQFAAPMARGVWTNKGAAAEDSKRVVTEFDVRTPGVNVLSSALSGGNQQKVALAKLLAVEPKVIFLDEPTRGVDVGAKAEIHSILRGLADNGVGVAVISSEMPELIGLCDRVLVVSEGRIAGELSGANLTETNIMTLAAPGALSGAMALSGTLQ
jgi:ribose transport system ATP-binding protein